MASFANASARIRIANDNKKNICAFGNINPTVNADTATAFVRAIEKVYNNGTCNAKLNISYEIA